MERIKLLFEDMSFHTSYESFEAGKSNDELEKVAKKRGVVYPCKDISIFKGKYAFTDEVNANGCILPKEEVEKALDTLVGKSVDIDHYRRSAVGFWLDSYLKGDTIISYAAFWKGSFGEEYDEFQNKMKDGKIKISFEAWGDREATTDGNYNLRNIEFAGGALLDETDPAFKNAEVLEFASIIEESAFSCECIKCGHKETSEKHCKDLKCSKCGGQMRRAERPGPGQGVELSRFYINDTEAIIKLASEVECETCEVKGAYDILSINYAENELKARCVICDAEMVMYLTPTTKLTKKGRTIKEVKETKRGSVKGFDDILREFNKSDEKLNEIIVNFEGGKLEEGKELTYEERKDLPDKMFAIVKSIENKETGKLRKIRIFPIHTPDYVTNAMVKSSQDKVKTILGKLGISIDNVKKKILKRAKELNMKTLNERYIESDVDAQAKLFKEVAGKLSEAEEKISGLEATISESEKAKVERETADAKAKEDFDKVSKEAADAKAEIARRDEEIKKVEIAKRKEELGDAAKDISDEDILNEDKYRIAKLTKENAELKKTPVKTDDTKPDLSKGSRDKEIEDNKEVFEKAKKVNESVFPAKE